MSTVSQRQGGNRESYAQRRAHSGRSGVCRVFRRPVVRGAQIKYPTMLDMTFPEFEAAVKKTDIVLLPIGAIEEHSTHLPLGTDAMNAVAQLFEVQEYLRKGGFDTYPRALIEHRHYE